MNMQREPSAKPPSATRRCASPARRSRPTSASRSSTPTPTRWSAPCPRRGPSMCARPSPRPRAFKPKLTRYERQQILLRPPRSCATRKEEFARLITAEVRPVLEGLALRGGPRLRRLFVRRRSSPSRTTARSTPATSPRTASRARSSPRASRCCGVISAITPFNHPLNMVAHKLAPAIATNNRVVLKPTELTPLTALALADVLYEAGLPPEMLSVVTGNPSDMGDAMITDPDCDLITFTGLGAGRQVHRRQGRLPPHRAGARRQRSADRHGGRRPRQGGRARRAGATKNSGQRCTAVKRILVVDKRRRRLRRSCVLAKAQASSRPATRWTPRPTSAPSSTSGAATALRAPRQRRRRKGARSSCTATTARARSIRRPWSTTCRLRLRTRARGDVRPGDPDHPLSERHRRA